MAKITTRAAFAWLLENLLHHADDLLKLTLVPPVAIAWIRQPITRRWRAIRDSNGGSTEPWHTLGMNALLEKHQQLLSMPIEAIDPSEDYPQLILLKGHTFKPPSSCMSIEHQNNTAILSSSY
jgi:hypothetical protein